MAVDVSSSGAILLGDKVTCDGFVYDCPIRVQTHVHTDHMDSFQSSKGMQNIILSKPSLELLIAEYNGDLPYRDNIQAIPTRKSITKDKCRIRLLDNGHMLGSVQVEVTLPSGLRCGYSGDFAWPLEEVIQVDELVLDSTYGSPSQVRKFTQEEANDQFLELVSKHIKVGPVFIMAHRGTLYRALSCLEGAVKSPIIASSQAFSEIQVYQKYGYSLNEACHINTSKAKQAVQNGRYIRIYGHGDRLPTDPSGSTCIRLSAYMSKMEHPVIEYSKSAFMVALSDHADFVETLEYVRATGARMVITDNTRGGHAVELALALRRELGINARPSQGQPTKEWGR